MARSELERAWRGMERDAVTDGARRGMGVRHWMGEPRGVRLGAQRGRRQQRAHGAAARNGRARE
jgi:hypothetical protein